jgi:transposase
MRCAAGAAGPTPPSGPTAPDPARSGTGANLQALAVYLMVMHFLPAHRCVQLLESLTGARPSVGFVHAMLARAAGLLAEVDKRIRTLIALAYVVCCDETPLRVGPRTPQPGRKKAEKYLLVACTDAYTHYLLGDRSLETFKASVVTELTGVIVHDRYQNYDSAELGELTHQLCCSHLLRDLDGAAETYPDAVWPTQIADALRGLIHQANLARAAGRAAIPDDVRDDLLGRFRHGVLVGLSQTTSHGQRPGERKTAAPRGAPRPAGRRAPLRPRPERATHLQPGRTRPATRQDPTKHLRPAHQRTSHQGPLPDPRLPVHRRQTRPQHHDRPPRHLPRQTLDWGAPRFLESGPYRMP